MPVTGALQTERGAHAISGALSRFYQPGFLLRILQFCTDFPESGGIQTHVLDLTGWLVENGHEVRFAGEPGGLVVPLCHTYQAHVEHLC